MARDSGGDLDLGPILASGNELDSAAGDASVVNAAAWRPRARGAFQEAQVAGPGASVGDVTATVLGGNLYLGEAAGHAGLGQGISVSRLANGHLLLTGHDPTNSGGGSSLINGQPSVELAVTGSLFANLGGGENQIVFDLGPGGPVSLESAAFNGGDGDDRYIIHAIETRGSLSFFTAGGDDWVFISGSQIGDGFGWDQLDVETGPGADTVTIKNGTKVQGAIDIQTYGLASETDGDVVYFDTEAYARRDVTILTGGGDDVVMATKDYEPTVFFGALETSGSLHIDLGAGDDRTYLRGVKTGGDFVVHAAAGIDALTIDNRPIPQLDGAWFVPRIGGDLYVQTYDDATADEADSLTIYDATVMGSLMAHMGGGNDYFHLDDAEIIKNDLTLEMGDGDDTAVVSAFVLDHLMARMGAGNDVLQLSKTWAYRLIADGGTGYDALTRTSQTQSQFLDQFGWETINGRRTLLDDLVWDWVADGGLMTP
jgi:hypothetical protein